MVFALGLSLLFPWWLAALGGFAGWLALLRRGRSIWSDPPRPAWRVRLFDDPLFMHFGASFFGLGALPFALVVVAVCGLERLFAVAAASSYGLGLLTAGYSLAIARRRVRIREIEVRLPGLHAALDGYRIVQLSDLHLGSYDRLERGMSWAQMANALAPDLAVVTGDLVTSGSAYYEDAADVLAALEARDGTFAVLGNHDQWAPERLVRLLDARGVRVLQNEWQAIERGGGRLVLAGIDDFYAGRADLERTLAGRPARVPTVLLAHYPTFFEAAAALGVELVLSGHTHGGQLGLPFFGDRVNFARLTGQASRGLVRRGESQLYVNAGLGTSGPPLRLGVPPEIALIVLRRA